MEDRSTGMSWIAVLFVIIVIFAIFGGNFGGGWGWNRGNNPYPPQEGGCNRVSNCEIERQGIADTARTQYPHRAAEQCHPYGHQRQHGCHHLSGQPDL